MLDARLRWKTRLFAFIVILSNAFGNFFLTWGMRHRGSVLTRSPLSYVAAIFSPWVSLGICLLIVWLLTRMTLLSWADLSYVLPVTSLGYVANALIGRFFLHEQITAGRWFGTLLIIAGTTLVGLSQPQASKDTSDQASALLEARQKMEPSQT
jgi:drug/metabolite transporter (DMT)-like permease